MSLLQLPAELILLILSHLPPFQPTHTETIGPNIPLTPPICRTSRILRHHALPLYAQTASFNIQTDDDLHTTNNRLSIWLSALEGEALSKVTSLQLSRHWKLAQPARWQGHVGFYLKLLWGEGGWRVEGGTYPVTNDERGLRWTSVKLLKRVVAGTGSLRTGEGLKQADVERVVSAMEVVVSHPIDVFDVDRSLVGRTRRMGIWEAMKRGLASIKGIEAADVWGDDMVTAG